MKSVGKIALKVAVYFFLGFGLGSLLVGLFISTSFFFMAFLLLVIGGGFLALEINLSKKPEIPSEPAQPIRTKSKKVKKNNQMIWYALPAVTFTLVIGIIFFNTIARPEESRINAATDTSTDTKDSNSGESWPVITSNKLLDEVNRRRAEVGSPALILDADLNNSAKAKCDDMATRNYFDHIDPDGKTGYLIAFEHTNNTPGHYSENLTRQVPQRNEKELFDTWFTSEPHKAAALDPKYTHTGFGVCGLRLVVQHFYSPIVE